MVSNVCWFCLLVLHDLNRRIAFPPYHFTTYDWVTILKMYIPLLHYLTAFHLGHLFPIIPNCFHVMKFIFEKFIHQLGCEKDYGSTNTSSKSFQDSLLNPSFSQNADQICLNTLSYLRKSTITWNPIWLVSAANILLLITSFEFGQMLIDTLVCFIRECIRNSIEMFNYWSYFISFIWFINLRILCKIKIL